MSIGVPTWMIRQTDSVTRRNFPVLISLRGEKPKPDELWDFLVTEYVVWSQTPDALYGLSLEICPKCGSFNFTVEDDSYHCDSCEGKFLASQVKDNGRSSMELGYFGIIYRRWLETNYGIVAGNPDRTIEAMSREGLQVREAPDIAALPFPSEALLWVCDTLAAAILGGVAYDKLKAFIDERAAKRKRLDQKVEELVKLLGALDDEELKLAYQYVRDYLNFRSRAGQALEELRSRKAKNEEPKGEVKDKDSAQAQIEPRSQTGDSEKATQLKQVKQT